MNWDKQHWASVLIPRWPLWTTCTRWGKLAREVEPRTVCNSRDIVRFLFWSQSALHHHYQDGVTFPSLLSIPQPHREIVSLIFLFPGSLRLLPPPLPRNQVLLPECWVLCKKILSWVDLREDRRGEMLMRTCVQMQKTD